jgi:hypothetical protein
MAPPRITQHDTLLCRNVKLNHVRNFNRLEQVVDVWFAMKLNSALDRLIQAGLLFRQGIPPHATYLFKHALVGLDRQDVHIRSLRLNTPPD